MSTLLTKSLRNLRSLRGRAVFIALIAAAGVAIQAGGSTAQAILFHTRDDYAARLHLADLEISISPSEEKELPDLTSIPGVAEVEPRLFAFGHVQRDGRPLPLLLVYRDAAGASAINRLELLEGRELDPADPSGAVVDKTMAEIHHYRIGDVLIVNPSTFPIELHVRGIGVTPEFLMSTSNPDLVLPMKGSLGVAFVPGALQRATFDAASYNDLSIRIREGAQRDAVEKQILERLAGARIGVERVTPREQQFGYRVLDENLQAFSAIIPVIALVFELLGFLVIAIAMNRLVASERRELGTLMALGYGAGPIFASYLLTGAILGAAGSALGALCAPGVAFAFASAAAAAIGLPKLVLTFPPLNFLIAFGTGLFATTLSTIPPLLQILRVDPQEAIRGAHAELFLGFPPALDRLLSSIACRSAALHYGLRNIFRRPRLTAATVLLIALAMAISTAFVLNLGSWARFAETAFAHEEWDAIIGFNVPLARGELAPIEALEGVAKTSAIVAGYGKLRDGDYARDYRLFGIPARGHLRRYRIVEGAMLSADDSDEIMVNRNFTRGHRFRAGSIVELTAGAQTHRLRIAAVIDDMTTGVAILPIATAQRIFGREGRYSAILARFAPGRDPQRMRELFFQQELVNYVSLKAEVQGLVSEYLRLLTGILELAAGFSAILSVLFMMSSLSITLLEREGEYATLATLGFPDRAIAVMVSVEVAVQALAGAALSVPLSLLLAWLIESRTAEAWFAIPLFTPLSSFAAVIGPALLVLPMAIIPGLAHLFRLDLAGAARKKSYG